MDESWGKSAFSIRLTFGGRNINLMRAFQPRFVIRAEWSKFVHTHTTEGHSGRWNCMLCCEGGMKANVSVSGHDTVEYKWHCHQVLHKVPREFHSSKLHYLDGPGGIVSEWEEGREGCHFQVEDITLQLAAGMEVTGYHYTRLFCILLCSFVFRSHKCTHVKAHPVHLG